MAIVTSQVRIWNRAMILLGSVERITSISDSGPLANQARDLWHESRRGAIVAHPWNFAIKRAQLNRAGTVPAFGYSGQFGLPEDYLRWLPAATDSCDWFEGEEEGGYILCNRTDPINIRYIADREDVTMWSPHFVELMAYKLAMDLAESATQIAGNVDDMRVKYEGQDGEGGALAKAKRLDGLSTGRRGRSNIETSSRWLSGYGVNPRRAPGT